MLNNTNFKSYISIKIWKKELENNFGFWNKWPQCINLNRLNLSHLNML